MNVLIAIAGTLAVPAVLLGILVVLLGLADLAGDCITLWRGNP